MHSRFLSSLGLALSLAACATLAQQADAPPQNQQQDQQPSQSGRRGTGRGGSMEGRGVIGKITSIGNGTIEITRPDGSSATVKLSGETQFRKDREPAKLSDFKVGDFIFVRGDQAADHSYAAQIVAMRTGARMEGGRVFAGGPGGGFGEMGKDFVVGEVKSIDAPKIIVLRPDNVTQTLELNEDTALRKGRDSITMADIQPGDHLIARGGLQNNAFVPKNVVVLTAEQWQRMQEMGMERGGQSKDAPGKDAPAGAPKPNPPQR